MSRRFHVFVNQEAGFGDEEAGSVDETATQAVWLKHAFGEHGIDATVVRVDVRDLPPAMLAAWQDGTDALVIGGGDGTVNCAAQVAIDNNIVMGVLPMGTFNHFAKDLGTPVELAEAVRFLAVAEPTAVDVGEVNGRVFVNNASLGIYPKMVSERDEIRARHAWGKVRAVPVAVARTMRRLPILRLRLTIDQSPPIMVKTPMLFVGNGLFDERGRRIGHRTSLSDHRLATYVIATTSRWRLIANIFRSRFGGLAAAPSMDRYASEELRIDADRSTLTIALDGEPIDVQAPLMFRSRAAALQVLATPIRDEGGGPATP